MINFLIKNSATIILSAIIFGIIGLTIRKVIRDRKNGGCSSCKYNCASCDRASIIHNQDKNTI